MRYLDTNIWESTNGIIHAYEDGGNWRTYATTDQM